MDHPRWGLIQSVVASRDINVGEELFGYYGYQINKFPDDIPWYHEQKNMFEKEQRLKLERKKLDITSNQIDRYIGTRYIMGHSRSAVDVSKIP